MIPVFGGRGPGKGEFYNLLLVGAISSHYIVFLGFVHQLKTSLQVSQKRISLLKTATNSQHLLQGPESKDDLAMLPENFLHL